MDATLAKLLLTMSVMVAGCADGTPEQETYEVRVHPKMGEFVPASIAAFDEWTAAVPLVTFNVTVSAEPCDGKKGCVEVVPVEFKDIAPKHATANSMDDKSSGVVRVAVAHEAYRIPGVYRVALLHEIGHLLDLDHEEGTLMNWSIAGNPGNVTCKDVKQFYAKRGWNWACDETK